MDLKIILDKARTWLGLDPLQCRGATGTPRRATSPPESAIPHRWRPDSDFPQHSVQFDKWTRGLARAFAVGTGEASLSEQERVLLEKISTAVVRRHMAEPLIFCLESLGPMNFLGSQALYFLEPFLGMVCSTRDWETLAVVLEKRGGLGHLIRMIEKEQAAQSASGGA